MTNLLAIVVVKVTLNIDLEMRGLETSYRAALRLVTYHEDRS